MRRCKQCETSIDHKRKDAVYCTVVCKKAYHHTQNYQDPTFVEKNRNKAATWRSDNPLQCKTAVLDWHSKHPDRVAAIKGKAAALRRGSGTSELYDLELCVAFYREARRRTAETGVRHEVDHTLAISKGGLHCQTNLQVLTQVDNLTKRYKSNE